MNCDNEAVALLTFSPQDAKAWLYDLDQPDPTGGIMLCRKHANGTVVPMSWQLVDARDPAWPGPAGSQPVVQAMAAATAEELAVAGLTVPEPEPEPVLVAAGLPSDVVSIDQEFAALHADLPVRTRQYAEPELATVRAANRQLVAEALIDLDTPRAPDPSLFELPLSDVPAVTPHPGF